VSRVRTKLALFVADVFASVPRKDQRAKGDCCLRGLMMVPQVGPDAWAVDDVSFPKDGRMSGGVAHRRQRHTVPRLTQLRAGLTRHVVRLRVRRCQSRDGRGRAEGTAA